MENNGKLAILVPSRGRPKTFARLLESWVLTSAGCSDLILRNGEADPTKDTYAAVEDFPNVIRVVGPDTGFNTNWTGTAGYNPAQQDLWERYPGYSAYLCIEDDTVLHNPGWDRWVLDTLGEYPGRVGVIELYDRSQTIHCLAMSAEWCNTLGYLCHPELGESAFEQTLAIAHMPPVMIRGAKGYAEFTHFPHVRAYGYTGDERIGAMERGNEDVVARYYSDQQRIFNEWMPNHAVNEKGKLIAAWQKARS